MKTVAASILGIVLTTSFTPARAHAQYYEDVPLGLWFDVAGGGSTVGGGAYASLDIRQETWLLSFHAATATDGYDFIFGAKTIEINDVGVLVGRVYTDEFIQLSASVGASVTWKGYRKRTEQVGKAETTWTSSKVGPGLPVQVLARLKLPAGMSNLSVGVTAYGNINTFRPYVAAGVVFGIGVF